MPLPNDPSFTGAATPGRRLRQLPGISWATLALPQTSNFIVGRIDHDFGEKWTFMSSYRYYNFSQLVNTQTDIGGLLGRDRRDST